MKKIITSIANKNFIEPEFLLTLVKIESNFNPWAIRYEKDYIWYYRSPPLDVEMTLSTLTNSQKYSYGLCQVMGSLYYEYGYKGYCSELFDPELNLEIACKHIKKFRQKYDDDLYDVVAAYNQGSNRKRNNGSYYNQNYVDKFFREYKSLATSV